MGRPQRAGPLAALMALESGGSFVRPSATKRHRVRQAQGRSQAGGWHAAAATANRLNSGIRRGSSARGKRGRDTGSDPSANFGSGWCREGRTGFVCCARQNLWKIQVCVQKKYDSRSVVGAVQPTFVL